MSWETELAMEFKRRNNPQQIGPVIGVIISVSPLKISILNGEFVLDASNSYICNQVLQRNSSIKASGKDSHSMPISIDGTVELGTVLKVGEWVMVVPTTDNQKFFIVDVVKGVQ